MTEPSPPVAPPVKETVVAACRFPQSPTTPSDALLDAEMELVEAKLPIIKWLVFESETTVTEPEAGVVKLALGSCTQPMIEAALTLA